jgi:TP901 family phage tail tape measure protein
MAKSRQDLDILINAKDNASKVIGGLKKETSGFGTATKAAMGVAAAGAVALGAVLVKSIGVAANFQQKMAGVAAVTGATGEDFDKLTALAKEMGSTTKFSASDAAEGIEFLGMAGFETDEIMSALPKTLALAAAGNLELGAAADIASNVLSGMRLPVEELGGVVDGLAVTAASSNTNVAQLGEGFKQVAPGAAAAGLSFEQTAASLGVLADNGIQAGAGGTALNAALRTMLRNSIDTGGGLTDAQKKMKAMGLEFVDSAGKVRPMTDIVADLEEANLSATDALVIFGEEGGRAINALVGSGSERLKELTGKIDDGEGAAKKMADTMSNTFQGAMTSLGSATEGLMITLGERFLPILADLLNTYVIPAVRKFNEWMEAVGSLGGAFTTALEVVKGFGTSVLKIVENFAFNEVFRRKFLDSLGSMIGAGGRLFTNYVKNLGEIMTAGAKVLFEPIKFAFSIIWEPIKRVATRGINGMAGAVVKGVNGIIQQINKVAGALGLEIDLIDWSPIAEDAPESVEDRWFEAKRNMATHFDAMTKAAEGMATDIKKDATEMGEAIGETWEAVEPLVDDSVKEIVGNFADAADDIVDKAGKSGEEAGTDLVVETAKAVKKEAPQLETAGEEAGEQILTGLNDKLSGADGIGGVLVGGLTSVLEGGSFKSAAKGIAEGIGGLIGGPLGSLVGKGLSGAVSSISSILGGKGKAEKRLEAVAGLQEAIGRGDISSFTGGGALGATLTNAGSAKLTLDAFMSVFDLEAADAAGLIKLLSDPAGLSGQGSTVNRFNELLGASENFGLFNFASGLVRSAAEAKKAANLTFTEASTLFEQTGEVSEGFRVESNAFTGAQWLVRAARGFNGMVTKPTMFLAGEAGPEQVTVTPEGGSSGGAVIHITMHNNFLDVRGVPGAMQMLGPEIVRYLDQQGIRGSKVMTTGGIVQERAA